MSPVFIKLNYRGQPEIVVVNAPASFEPDLDALGGVTVHRHFDAVEVSDFVLAFGTTRAEVEVFAAAVAAKTRGDAVVWFAYPKGTSKRYRCEFNRDTGWQALGHAGFEPVRQVALDADWSALRFRRVAFIRQMTRDPKRRLSADGKTKATAGGNG